MRAVQLNSAITNRAAALKTDTIVHLPSKPARADIYIASAIIGYKKELGIPVIDAITLPAKVVESILKLP